MPAVAVVGEEDRSGGVGGRDGGRGRRGSQEGGGRTQVSAGCINEQSVSQFRITSAAQFNGYPCTISRIACGDFQASSLGCFFGSGGN